MSLYRQRPTEPGVSTTGYDDVDRFFTVIRGDHE